MNELKNGIPAIRYYELLEWKDDHIPAFNIYCTMLGEFYGVPKKYSVSDLTSEELKALYLIVFKKDL